MSVARSAIGPTRQRFNGSYRIISAVDQPYKKRASGSALRHLKTCWWHLRIRGGAVMADPPLALTDYNFSRLQ